MRRDTFGTIIGTVALFSTALVGAAQAEDLGAKWQNGLRFESEDKSIALKMGGRIHNDWTVFANADETLETVVGEFEDGVEFRTARLYMAGKLYKKLEFKAQYDFAGGDADFKDVYMGILQIPVVGNLRVGQFKEPFSLENLTSSNYITFMERSILNTFAPGRTTGIMLHNAFADEMVTTAAGFFRDSDSFGNNSDADDNSYSYTARLTASPVYEEDGETLVHIGAAWSFRNLNDDSVSFANEPEVHLAPNVVDSADIAADDLQLVNVELAAQVSSVSVQSEYTAVSVSSLDGADPDFWSWYLQASIFLTGEYRPYDRAKAVFGRVSPEQPYISADGGSGALELAARYSMIDLNDAGTTGGELDLLTLGLNWYMHANSRIMFNWVHGDEDVAGDFDALSTRFQVDF